MAHEILLFIASTLFGAGLAAGAIVMLALIMQWVLQALDRFIDWGESNGS